MGKLKITKNHQLIQEIQLDPAQTYLAGRAESCQIKLDSEPGVSRQHFQLSFRDQHWVLEVLSKYGELYINEEKSATQFDLIEGMIFQVPPYEFIFGEGSIRSNESFDSSSDKTAISILPNASYLKLVDHQGSVQQLFRLEGEAWIAGRDVTCSIFIDNPRVSRKQFEIYREDQKYFIRDLGSANGTIVNGHQISNTEWTQMHSADVIAVVDWTLHFEVHDSQFKQRVEESQPSPLSDTEEFLSPDGKGSLQSGDDEFLPTNYSPIPQDDINPSQFSADQQQQNSYFPAPMMGQANGQQPGTPFSGYQVPPPPPIPPLGKFAQFKAKMNPVRILIFGFIIGAILYGIFPENQNAKKEAPKVIKSKTPFDNLSPEDQQYVVQSYAAADQYIRQQLFQNALDEIIKIESRVKYYQDSTAIKEIAQNALATIALQRDEEKTQNEKVEMELKIQKQVADCDKMINSEKLTISVLENCLSPVLSLNPEHPQIVALKKRAEFLISERELKKAKRAEYQDEARKLKLLFDKSYGLHQTEKWKDAIKAYEVVIGTKLPDPAGLKQKAKNNIAAIKKKLEDDQRVFLENADQMMQEGKFRDAVLFLQKALKLNPESEPIKLKLNTATTELRKQMQIIFQDSILEESVGEVDAAKLKWKKIMDLSVPNEEYFEKARLKLRKYGVI